MGLKIFHIGAILLGCGSVVAQTNDACLKEVKIMYQKLKLMENAGVPEGKTWYFNYTVRTATTDSVDAGVFSSSISMWANGKDVQVKSKEMEMYQSADDAFILLPERKQMVRIDPYLRQEKDKAVLSSRVNMVQDTLFALSKVVKCDVAKDKKVVVLDVNEKGKQLLHVRKVTFVINTREQRFESLKVEYDKNEGLTRDVVYVEYRFHEVNYNYTAKNISENLSKKFLKTSKEPSEAYKGYTLVDNRQKKMGISSKQWK